ncbi:hypothetical protein [Saccharolobus solfataricus]|uniref:ORF2 in transposon ISC1316 partial n=3 Tax=Saccharolobus solfataricus TaxID=2287 RepID=A0A157T0D2_SACSO|nr:hypothetical protein [Saccharolobus solfataricus]SAI84877.1 ORF2 in transposon ISC1316 partial [Saccharolobus solfataricus]
MEEIRPYYNTFSLPITKSGKSQIVPPPPWIYAIEMQWCFTNFTQNDTISMEEKNIRAELEKSAYFNTRSKKFSYLLKKLTENEFIYKE